MIFTTFVLTELFILNKTNLFDPSTSSHARSLALTLILVIYPVVMLITSPFLGFLSDKYGRKPIIIAGLTLSFVGMLIMGVGVSLNSLTLIYASRIISGIVVSSSCVVLAAIIDLSAESNKIKNLALILAAEPIGYIIARLIDLILLPSYVLSDTTYLSVPIFVCAFLMLVTLISICFFFKGTYAGDRMLKINYSTVLKSAYSAITNADITLVLIITLMFSLGINMFGYFICLLGPNLTISYFFLISAFSYIFIVPYITRRFTMNNCLTTSVILQFSALCLLVVLGIVLTPSNDSNWFFISFFIVVTVVSILQSCTSIILISILSNSAKIGLQGSTMGVYSSIIAFTIGVIVLIPITEFDPKPWAFAAFLIASILSFVFASKQNRKQGVASINTPLC